MDGKEGAGLSGPERPRSPPGLADPQAAERVCLLITVRRAEEDWQGQESPSAVAILTNAPGEPAS